MSDCVKLNNKLYAIKISGKPIVSSNPDQKIDFYYNFKTKEFVDIYFYKNNLDYLTYDTGLLLSRYESIKQDLETNTYTINSFKLQDISILEFDELYYNLKEFNTIFESYKYIVVSDNDEEKEFKNSTEALDYIISLGKRFKEIKKKKLVKIS